MPTLLLRFPGRRYHATPWGHHVNEGLIEWPPSPWRLLRALLATGYTAGDWDGSGPTPMARGLIEKLAAVLPRYRLPPCAGAHSRHFMPIGALDKGREKTTLVFDTWAQIDDGVLAVDWDVCLSAEETALLRRLAEKLGYLGRSESWVIARLGRDGEPIADEDWNCFPCADASAHKPGWEQVPLLAASSTQAYGEWRRSALQAVLADLPKPDTSRKRMTAEDRKRLADRERATEPYPSDLLSSLQVDTSWLRRYGWSQPPGTRRVLYWRPADALEAGAPKPRLRSPCAAPVEAMLLAMATGSGNDHALPNVTRTLPQAERLHEALVGAFARDNPDAHSRVLTGCDERRKPLRGRHEHGHVLPLDLDDDGHLDHFLVWAPMGLDGNAQAAVRAVRRTFTKGGIGPLRLALAGCGDLSDMRDLPSAYGSRLRAVLGPPEGASEWTSVTPFVPPRHIKKHGPSSLAGQLAAELASRGLPPPLEVRIFDPHEDDRARRHRHFMRRRRRAPAPPVDCGFTITLRLVEPIRGPLCLGYASHFGLGLFACPSQASL